MLLLLISGHWQYWRPVVRWAKEIDRSGANIILIFLELLALSLTLLVVITATLLRPI